MAQIRDANGSPVLVLALTDEDIVRMKAGEPLYCHTADFPAIADVDFALTWGGNREEAARALAHALPPGSSIVRLVQE